MTNKKCTPYLTKDEPLIIRIRQNPNHCTTNHCSNLRSSNEQPNIDSSKLVDTSKAAPFPFKESPKAAAVASVSHEQAVIRLDANLTTGEKFPLFREKSPPQQKNHERSISSKGSESTLSVVLINEKLPVLIAREHGPHCTLEVSVLEKHVDGCSRKKVNRGGRTLDDKVGSYDVVGRMIYRTCDGSEDSRDGLKGSAKGFKLNDPDWFGKDLREKRSRVETLPILPNYDNYVLHIQEATGSPRTPTTPRKYSSLKERKSSNPKPICAYDESPTIPIMLETPEDNNPKEVLSVYIRTDKSEKVPIGFQKMHYRGDSCKLHDPNERSRQILALQKVINETTSGAEISKSNKTFNQGRETQIMTAAVENAGNLPETLYQPVKIQSSHDSLVEALLKETEETSSKKSENSDNDIEDLYEYNHDKYLPSREEESANGFLGWLKRYRSKKNRASTVSSDDKSNGSRRTIDSETQYSADQFSTSSSSSPDSMSMTYSLGQRKYVVDKK